MYETEPLLVVEDHFLISGRGLVLLPVLQVPPEDRRFKTFSDTVLLRLPDDSERRFHADCRLEHFSRPAGKGSWNILVLLPHATKEDVPVGSKLFVTPEAHDRIRGQLPNNRQEQPPGAAQP